MAGTYRVKKNRNRGVKRESMKEKKKNREKSKKYGQGKRYSIEDVVK